MSKFDYVICLVITQVGSLTSHIYHEFGELIVLHHLCRQVAYLCGKKFDYLICLKKIIKKTIYNKLM